MTSRTAADDASQPSTAATVPVPGIGTDDCEIPRDLSGLEAADLDAADPDAEEVDASAISDAADARRMGDTQPGVVIDLAQDRLPAAAPVRAPGRYERFVKPVLDRLVAAVVLLLCMPLFVALSIAILATMGRPIFFKQERIGKNGKPFTMLKFRSMKHDRREGEERRSTARARRSSDRRRTHKTNRDPRHTRLGLFMRAYSLDELPQLWNVIRGDLSLVGPRPELTAVVESRYEDWQHRRHDVRPGLSGLWQVTERDDEGEMHRHVDTDLRYVDYLGWRLDAAILILTVPALLGVILVESPRALTARLGRPATSDRAVSPRAELSNADASDEALQNV